MAPKKFKSLSVSEKVYNKLREIAEKHGFSTLADTVAYLVSLEELVVSRLDTITRVSGNITATTGNITRTSGNVTTTSGNIRKRKTMLDIIHERKIQLLSEIKPRDSTRFVTKAQSYGIVVIEGAKDTALVEPEFYEEFKNILKEINTMNEEKIRKQLDDKMFKLFTFLRENGLIYFDATDNTWKFI